MLKQNYVIMEADLKLFDDAAATPAAPGSEGAQAETGGSVGTGDAGQDTDEEPVVMYGKQPEHNDDPEPTGEPTEKEGDLEDLEQPSDDPEGDDGSNTDLNTLLKSNDQVKKQFDERVQNIINKRFKETKSLEEKINKLDPVLDILKERYEVEDTDQLLETLENETIEELAYRKNMDPKEYKHMKELERENQQLKDRVGKRNTEETDKQVQERVKQWYDEAEELQKDFQNFDLREASQNEEFLKLLKAGVGVRAAFQATNFDNILKQKLSAATKQTKENTIESIKSKKTRVSENGTRNAPGAIVKDDVSQLTAEDRKEIARRVRDGEKIQF